MDAAGLLPFHKCGAGPTISDARKQDAQTVAHAPSEWKLTSLLDTFQYN